MADKSAIEWTDATWNPVTGCTRVSAGCAHCYIERTPPFRMAGRRFEIVDNVSTTGVLLHPDRLEQPLRWTRPRRVFVCSLADLFHEDISFEYILRVFRTMRDSPQHVFQVLTKRPERMAQFIALWRSSQPGTDVYPSEPEPNIWLGVSIENARYTWRADVLREIPAAVRFISAEPLLGSLYTDSSGERAASHSTARSLARSVVEGGSDDQEPGMGARTRAPLNLDGIDWIIAGGESGPGARPMQVEWVREIIRAATPLDSAPLTTAVFVKQLGAKPIISREELAAMCAVGIKCEHGYDVCPECDAGETELPMVDRKGGDWDEWPHDLRIRDFPALGMRVAA